MIQGLVNGLLNETLTHSGLKFEWFSVGYGFIYIGHSLLFFSPSVSTLVCSPLTGL